MDVESFSGFAETTNVSCIPSVCNVRTPSVFLSTKARLIPGTSCMTALSATFGIMEDKSTLLYDSDVHTTILLQDAFSVSCLK